MALHRFQYCATLGLSILLPAIAAQALPPASSPTPSATESPNSEPLPKASDLLDRFVQNSDRDAENDIRFRRLYQYDKITASEEKDSAGKVLKSESRTLHHDPEKYARNQGDIPEGDASPKATSRRRPGRPSRQTEITQDLLSRFAFDVESREWVNGRPTIRLKFLPAPPSKKSPPDNGPQDRILRQLRGHLWIDEHDGLMQKAKFELGAPVEFFAGIAGAIQSLSVDMTRRRTEEGLWFTERLTWNFSGRQLLSRRSASGSEIRTNWSKALLPASLPPQTLAP